MIHFTLKDLFFTSKLRDLTLITVHILFIQSRISSASEFIVFKDKYPLTEKLTSVAAFEAEKCRDKTFSNFWDKNVNVVAFFAKSAICALFSLSGMNRIYLNADIMINSILKEEKGWITFVPKQRKQLVVLWPLTDFTKGKNFGSAGAVMDLDVAKCTFATEGGPKGISKVRFCKIDQTPARAHVALRGKDCSPLLFEFSKEFTIGLWVKHVSAGGAATLVSGAPAYSPRFEISPTIAQVTFNFLYENVRNKAVSTIDNTDLDDWRHLAVRYRPRLNVTFFRNGKIWPNLEEMEYASQMKRPYELVMWARLDDKIKSDFRMLKGQIACVAIYQLALSDSEMQYLPDRCP